jgi:hypothetical protein
MSVDNAATDHDDTMVNNNISEAALSLLKPLPDDGVLYPVFPPPLYAPSPSQMLPLVGAGLLATPLAPVGLITGGAAATAETVGLLTAETAAEATTNIADTALADSATQTLSEMVESATQTETLPRLGVRRFVREITRLGDDPGSVLMTNYGGDIVEFDPQSASSVGRAASNAARSAWVRTSEGIWRNMGNSLPK